MKARHSIVALAVGPTLAAVAPVAEGQLAQGTILSSGKSSSALSASALRAENRRWQAIAKQFLEQAQHERLHADDRAGPRGA
jgi:hypothetical protein